MPCCCARSEIALKEAFRCIEDDRWVSCELFANQGQGSRVAAGLLALGVEPEDRVAIASNTRIEWILADLGMHVLRRSRCDDLPVDSARGCALRPRRLSIQVVFAEDDLQVSKQSLDHLDEQLPHLITIVQLDVQSRSLLGDQLGRS